MNPTDLIPSILKPVAKAVAAFLTVWLVAGVTWVAEATGVPVEDVGLDPNGIRAVIVSVLVGLGAWWAMNLSEDDGDEEVEEAQHAVADNSRPLTDPPRRSAAKRQPPPSARR